METKKSQCLKAISTYYLNCKPNVRINNSIFWTSMRFSRGTVYSCINELQKARAVEIKNSTKRGSYINKINYGKLFQYAQNKKVIFVLPLPSTKNIRIISTALDNVFKINNIPWNWVKEFCPKLFTKL